jgi:hypothetical protein
VKTKKKAKKKAASKQAGTDAASLPLSVVILAAGRASA